MKRTLLAVSLTALLAGLATPSLAEEVKPEDAIKYRKGVFGAVKWQYGPLAAMSKGEVPYNKDEVTRRAELLAALAKMPGEGFGPGTDKGADTKAKPEIWKEKAKFDKAMEAFQQETAKLADAARKGDQNAVKAAVAAVGKTCKACHDDFKSK